MCNFVDVQHFLFKFFVSVSSSFPVCLFFDSPLVCLAIYIIQIVQLDCTLCLIYTENVKAESLYMVFIHLLREERFGGGSK